MFFFFFFGQNIITQAKKTKTLCHSDPLFFDVWLFG